MFFRGKRAGGQVQFQRALVEMDRDSLSGCQQRRRMYASGGTNADHVYNTKGNIISMVSSMILARDIVFAH